MRFIPALLALMFSVIGASAEDVTFSFTPTGGTTVTSVTVRGEFNGWGKTEMRMLDDGTWTVTVDLGPGEYKYKYFIDNEWPEDMSSGHGGGPFDEDADNYVDDGFGGKNAVRIVGGGEGQPETKAVIKSAPPLAEGQARIHYHRPRGGYSGWGLHVWEDAAESVSWSEPLAPSGQDIFGIWWDIKLVDAAKKVGFIIHKGEQKDPGSDMFLDMESGRREIWVTSGSGTLHGSRPDVTALAFGDLTRQKAHWIDIGTIAWNVPATDGAQFKLHRSAKALIKLQKFGVDADRSFALEPIEGGLTAEQRKRFPHLASYRALRVPAHLDGIIDDFITGQHAVSVQDDKGKLLDATGLQLAGVLDDKFAFDGPLGVVWDDDKPTVYLWAPTARQALLLIFDTPDGDNPSRTVSMSKVNGVWRAGAREEWWGKYYAFDLAVYTPSTGAVEHNRVTDPYARALSKNSKKGILVDLDHRGMKPRGWGAIEKPAIDAPEDIVLYELHIRDFSAAEKSLPDSLRGTYLAFTKNTAGTRHLRSLAEAGLTHVHLMPTFDIATVDEDKSHWGDPGDLSRFAPDSEEQQKVVAAASGSDAYNWGYDPLHYGVPEGSYATEAEGLRRIKEFRKMVAALADMGLRVVMDVVYNHTHASGTADQSILDKIVPGYYHRLNESGAVETSTCCQNTAMEHYMMERLMIDDLVHWAKDYKIDGFRFDLMGHHMKSNMEKARDALQSLTVEKDGVDGSSIYLYGEGWDFGEVQGGKRGVNATQHNMAGTGIGTFNDRLRDAVRGGNPFGDRELTGFATSFGTSWEMRHFEDADRIRFGLAGNLATYPLESCKGPVITGGRMGYAGYTLDPQETINYVSAHDNETFYDKIVWATWPRATAEDQVRMQCLAMSFPAFSQGIPFFHAGIELLRSKSLDADSYDSGDWFNKLDYSYESNNFGGGLPPAAKNRSNWPKIKLRLGPSSPRPGRSEIERTATYFQELLSIRKSSPLFRLRTEDQVKERVRFHNTGKDQAPGLIVMSIHDDGNMPDLDSSLESIWVVFNGGQDEVQFPAEGAKGRKLKLHPVQKKSVDAALRDAGFNSRAGEFSVPGLATAVFVER